MLRLALPLLLGLALTSPARAESLRPPVDDAVWRVIEGSGGEAPRRIGWVPFVVTMALAGPATFVSMFAGLGTGAALGRVAGPAGQVVGLLGGAVLLGAALHAVAAITGGVLARVHTNWLLAVIVGAACLTLAGAVFSIPGVGSQMIPGMLTIYTAAVVAGVAVPLAAFGPPAWAWWAD